MKGQMIDSCKPIIMCHPFYTDTEYVCLNCNINYWKWITHPIYEREFIKSGNTNICTEWQYYQSDISEEEFDCVECMRLCECGCNSEEPTDPATATKVHDYWRLTKDELTIRDTGIKLAELIHKIYSQQEKENEGTDDK